jgi:hypothetical protein
MMFFFAEIAVIAVRPLVLLMGICKGVVVCIGFSSVVVIIVMEAMVVARLWY